MIILRLSFLAWLATFGFGWLVALSFSPAVFAATPNDILQTLTAETRLRERGFVPSAGRGEQFFRNAFKQGEAEACTACHTPDARNPGQHLRTHKMIEPLAPVANQQRFTDSAHVEKWFKRNCKEVLGRTCTSAEKADFVVYMIEVR